MEHMCLSLTETSSTTESSKDLDIYTIQKAFQSVGDYDGSSGLQCVDMTKWFVDTYTTINSARGNGNVQAKNTASANGLPEPTNIPSPYSIFSVEEGVRAYGASGGAHGHTGIVISVDEQKKQVTVLHTWNSLKNKNPNSVISVYPYPVSGVTFVHLGDYLK